MSEVPALKALLFVVFGVVVGTAFNTAISLIVVAAVAFCVLLLIYLKFRILFPIYFALCLAAGILISFNLSDTQINRPNKLLPEMHSFVEGRVEKIIRKNQDYIVCVVYGTIDTPELPKVENQRVLLKAKGNYADLYSGTHIKSIGRIRLPYPKTLPNEFDEENYLAANNIQWIARSQHLSWRYIDKNLYYLRDYITTAVKSKCEMLFPYNQHTIVKALVLGDKSEIPPEIRSSYSYSGTAHLLAQSGLHIGIISFILFTFLSYISNKWLKFLLFFTALAVFLFITGFQPSAVRASSMAILIVLAKTLERRYNIINIISLVVLISIAIEPALIYSAGFQMSVASILGIALLYPYVRELLNKWLPCDKYGLKYIKSSIAISIAASSIVSPLVAHYFGIYSNISIISNLFIIPIISFVLVLSIISLALSFLLPQIAMIYGEGVSFLLLLSERINAPTVSLPYSYIEGETALLLAIYMLLATIYISTSSDRRHSIFRFSAAMLLLFPFLMLFEQPEKREIEIIPRRQFTAAIIPDDSNKSFVFIADRKPAQYVYNDNNFIEYLCSKPDSLIIAVNGNAGINIADLLREKRDFYYIELNPDFQKCLEFRILGDKKLSQIIEIK